MRQISHFISTLRLAIFMMERYVSGISGNYDVSIGIVVKYRRKIVVRFQYVIIEKSENMTFSPQVRILAPSPLKSILLE